MMDGLLIFDKEKGITSHDLVYKVRKKLGIKKVGHTGTLGYRCASDFHREGHKDK